jgi:glycosyltransferase involved in cell wall biosynthesis
MNGEKKIIFLANWYPEKKAPHKGIFIRNHALLINSISELIVVDFQFFKSRKIFSIHRSRERDVDNMDVIHVHIYSFAYKLIYYLFFLQKRVLKNSFRKYNIDLSTFDFVISNVLLPCGIIGDWMSRRYALKQIHIEHWSVAKAFLSKSIFKRKGKRVIEESFKVVVVSDFLKEQIAGFRSKKKIEVIPNFISSHFQYIEKKRDSHVFRFIAVANWQKPKNPFLFIDAMQQIKKERPELEFELILVGEGPQLELIRSMKLDFPIHYAGVVPNSRMVDLYNLYDAFLHGSDYETFSIVSIEALMCGLPVVASKVGILPSVINETNGVLCDDTIESWKSGVYFVLQNNFFNRKKIAEATARRFSEQHLKNQFLSLLYK